MLASGTSQEKSNETMALTMAAVWVVAVVGDNHPGLQMGLRNVSKEYGFLVLRCACHSLQLVVKDLIKQFKDYQEATTSIICKAGHFFPADERARASQGVNANSHRRRGSFNVHHILQCAG